MEIVFFKSFCKNNEIIGCPTQDEEQSSDEGSYLLSSENIDPLIALESSEDIGPLVELQSSKEDFEPSTSVNQSPDSKVISCLKMFNLILCYVERDTLVMIKQLIHLAFLHLKL